MNRRLLNMILIAVFLMGFLSINLTSAQANDPAQEPSLSAAAAAAAPAAAVLPYAQAGESDVITFTQLGYTQDDTLRGPYDTAYYSFVLPADWQLNQGAEINIDLVTSFTMKGAAATSVPSLTWKDTFGGQLTVYLNNVLVGIANLVGDEPQRITLSLSPDALTAKNASGQHELYLAFDAGDTCYFDWTSSLIIKTTSSLILPHSIIPIVPDLTAYPRPIYQLGKIEVQKAHLVVPDHPSEAELQAAFAISGGLGRLSDNKLELSLHNYASLTEVQKKDANIIFVGKPSAFPDLSQVPLPAPVKESGFDHPLITADDGVIQMAVSPWNPSRVVMLVSGQSDAALYKAGQAASYGKIRVEKQKDLSIITEINELLPSNNILEDRTLADLGEPDLVFTGRGIISKTIPFYFPLGKTAAVDSYFEMIFSHSQVIDYERSGFSVRLNEIPVVTFRLSDETSNQKKVQIALPRHAIKPGMNFLRVQSELYPRFSCIQPGTSNLWAAVSPNPCSTSPSASSQRENHC